MTRLDPVRPDDPFLDPDGEPAAACRGRDAAPRPAARRPRALAAAGVAAAALAAIVALPRGESAQAAIVHAAERTAAHDSGRIVWRLEAPDGEVTTVFRFRAPTRRSRPIAEPAAGAAISNRVRSAAGSISCETGTGGMKGAPAVEARWPGSKRSPATPA